MRYKGGKLHTAKIKNRRYDINVSKNTDDGVYTTTVGNKTYKMKALKSAPLKSMIRVPSAAPLAAPLAAPSAAPFSANIPNQQLTPEQAAQKGINFMLKKQQQGFQRHNNDNATRIAAEKALLVSQVSNEEQEGDTLRRNTYNEMARSKAHSNAMMSSEARNKKQANIQALRNQQNMALRTEAQSNATMFSEARNAQQADRQKLRNQQNMALREEAQSHAQISSNEWHEQEVRMEKEENSILLPKKPSNMTPLQIAGQLERDLQQLEGPIYASVLVPKPELERILGRKPPVFLLVGDSHNGIHMCDSCKKPECYSLYKNKGKGNDRSTFLDYLDDQTKKNWIIDVFFEKWYGKDFRKSGKKSHDRSDIFDYNPNERESSHAKGEQASSLHDWSYILRPCIGYIQNPIKYKANNTSQCDYTHFRIHEGDVRHASYDNIFEKILRSLCYNILSFKKEQFDNYLYTFDRFKSKLESDLFDTTRDIGFTRGMGFTECMDFITLMCTDGTTIKSVIEHPASKYGRTIHELNQLPRELYDGIINNPELGLVFDNSSNNTILKQFRPHILHLCQLLKNIMANSTILGKGITKDELNQYAQIVKLFIEKSGVLHFNTAIVDLYTIARALKPFKKGYETSLYSQLAVSYFGTAHTYRTEILLKQWYTPHVSWATRSLKLLIHKTLSNSGDDVKCIKQIKNDTDDQMYPLINRLYQRLYRMVNQVVSQYTNTEYTLLNPDQIAAYIKVAEIMKNENKARAVFDPVQPFLEEKQIFAAEFTLVPLLKNFIKRYEELYPVKIPSKRNAVMSQLNEYSRKAKLNANAMASFVPSNAYYIMGHGGQMRETFTVPDQCIIIVKVAEGESFYQTRKYLPLICNMDLSVLTDPIKNRAELTRALGSVAIYYPGSTCPNFQYNLVESIQMPEFSIISEYGSGVVNMKEFTADKQLCALQNSYSDSSIERFKQVRENKNSDEIKSFIADSFKNSIYPTPEDVKIHIDLLNTDKTDISSIIEGLKDDPFFKPTQNDLCQKIKGVFLNFVCRPNNSLKPIIEHHIYEGFATDRIKNNIEGLLTLQDNPSFSNLNSIRNYKGQKLKEVEANIELKKKETGSLPIGADGSPERKVWHNAFTKEYDALKKLNSFKANKTRKLLQSRLEESVGFRKSGIRNMAESTKYNNAKRIQEYKNELAKIILEEEKDKSNLLTEKSKLNNYKRYAELGKKGILEGIDKEFNWSHLIKTQDRLVTYLEGRPKKRAFLEREIAKMEERPAEGGNRRFKRTRRMKR
jgi:hypothetical protein